VRSNSKADYRLEFVLPAAAYGLAPPMPGRHEPAEGTALTIGKPDAAGIPIAVESWSRVQCQDHARTFLKLHTKDARPLTIQAWLTYPPSWNSPRGGKDPWTIVVNSQISFAPTPVGSFDLDPVEIKARAPVGEVA